MFKKFVFMALVLAFHLVSSAQAATIIWVSDNKGPTDGVAADQGWVDLLETNGYTVDLSFRNAEGRTLDDVKIAALNAADLIIVSRDTNSGDYDDGDEITQWNSIETPLILQVAHLYRSSRWLWMNSTSTSATTANMLAVLPEHPIFEGVQLDANNEVEVVNISTSVGNNNVDPTNNYTLIATRSDSGADGVWIAEWEAAVEFYPGSGQFAGGPRMYFAAGGRGSGSTDGEYNLTSEGEKLFLNAVNYMLGGSAGPEMAGKPSPMNNTTVDLAEATPLSWTAGETASRHDVYFGTTFEDVNNAETSDTTGIYKGRQNLILYTPMETLELGQTYYWRIDEVEADNTTVFKGQVWSFIIAEYLTVDDFEDYNTDDNQIWWTWKDGLGYTAHDNEPAYPGNGTGSAVGDETTNSFTEESIVHSGRQSMPYWYNNNKQGFLTYSEATKTLTNTRDWTVQGIKALALWFRGYPPLLGGFVEAPAGTFTMSAEGADIWGASDQFHFAWQELNGEGEIIAKVESVENTNPWAKAGIMIRDSLDPDSAFAMVAVTPGNGVWFGRRTGGNTASDAQPDITAPLWIKLDRSIGGLARASYSSDGINWTPLGVPEPVTMNLPLYIGLALTSHEPGVACEAIFSNVTSNGTGQWVNQDIGLTSNEAQPMYVSVSNNNGTTGTVYYDDNQNIDSNATLIDTWTEWNIDLKDFQDQGVDLSNINSISVGIGDKDNPQPGGSGKMLFDDIRLYQARYVPDKVTPLRADFNGDGIVNDDDLEIMLNDWLLGDYTVYATPPGPAMAQWEFDNNVNDSIGGLNGIARGNPTYTAGQSGQAINLDGDDYVDLGNPPQLDFGIVDWSICAWVKTSMSGTGDVNKGVIYAKGGDRAGGIRYGLYVNENQTIQGTIDLVTDDDANKREAISSTTVNDGEWHHIVGLRAGETLNVYIDGVLDGTANLPADYDLSGTSQHNAFIGVVTDNSTAALEKFLVGSVDDVRIYDYALSQSEILDVMGVTELYFPLTSVANIFDEEPINSKQVNEKDRAILDEEWLQEVVWPEW